MCEWDEDKRNANLEKHGSISGGGGFRMGYGSDG
jgi:hypothetical protein